MFLLIKTLPTVWAERILILITSFYLLSVFLAFQISGFPYSKIRHRAYRHCMAFRLRYVSSLQEFPQELPPELLPMSENLTEEREIHLSPAGVRQRSLKMSLCSVTTALCSVRWPQSQPVFITFRADFSHYRIGNVQKRTPARSSPPQAGSAFSSVTIALCSVRWPQENAAICIIFSRIVTLQHRTSFL